MAHQRTEVLLSRDLLKHAYTGVESCEIGFDEMRVPGIALLGHDDVTMWVSPQASAAAATAGGVK